MDLRLKESFFSLDKAPSLPIRSPSHMPFTRILTLQRKKSFRTIVGNSSKRQMVLLSVILLVGLTYHETKEQSLDFSAAQQILWLENANRYSYKQRKMQTITKPEHLFTNKPRTVNERTKGLMEILSSAKEREALSWPEYLTLHKNNKAQPETPIDVSSCIVTAYFRVKSKHGDSSYVQWMQNMLSMHDCMVIFCEADMVPTVLKYRGNNRITAVISVKLEDLPISKFYYSPADTIAETTKTTAFWEHQLNIDPERKIHQSYRVFWIWLSKSWFVTTAALMQDHVFALNNRIEVWMWADIGSFRDHTFNNKQLIRYPDSGGLFPNTAKTAVLWMAHRKPNPPADPFWNRKLVKKEKHHFYQSGSHAVASSVSAWTTFHTHFVDTLDQYAAKGLFLGEDQCVIQSTCLLHPESCAYVPFDQVPDNRYFGLRTVLHYGPNIDQMKRNIKVKPFQLWRPPTTTTTSSTAKSR